MEAAFSVGVLSFGFLSLAPLLAVGLAGAREGRENRATAEIASTLIEQAREGTAVAGALYLDSASNPCPANQATYAVQATTTAVAAGSAGSGSAGPLTRLTIQVTPVGSPGAARIYADVFPTPPSP